MSLFSFLGGIAKTAISTFVPGGKAVVTAVDAVLSHKSNPAQAKVSAIQRVGPQVARGNATQMGYSGGYGQLARRVVSAQQLRASPVMPGGAVASTRGMLAKVANPPARFAGGGGGKRRRKAKPAAKRRSSTAKRSGGRKLKFGSPAWRAKYMKKKRR